MRATNGIPLGESTALTVAIINYVETLKARNVLIDENLHVKISDYGLSRDVDEDKSYYRMKTERPLPLRWSAKETVVHLKYSTASDVYAYGVLCFEVFSFGDFPFAALADERFLRFLAGIQEPGTSWEGGRGVQQSVGSSPDVAAMSEPLLLQLQGVLRKHGVHQVPELVEMLVRGCVTREPAERLTFLQISQRTNRANTVGLFLPAAVPTLPKGTNLQLQNSAEQEQRLRADSFC
jgi:serine/threonine protein kinase